VLHALRAKNAALLGRPLADGETPAQRRAQAHKLLFADYDQYLDQHRDIDWLHRPAVAALVRRNLYHHNRSKYHLLAYCILPNHVHVLLLPIDPSGNPTVADAGSVGIDLDAGQFDADAGCVGYVGEQPDSRSPLSAIMHSLKSYTANEANKLLG